MKLSVYLNERKISHGDMARLIGTSPEAVRRYANGLRLPRPEIRGSIIVATKGDGKKGGHGEGAFRKQPGQNRQGTNGSAGA